MPQLAVPSITPTLHHSITPSLHHSITPSLHHSITPSLHHSITPSLHHSITPFFFHHLDPDECLAPLGYRFPEIAADCERTPKYFELMGDSKFCFSPRGQSSWTLRFYESFFAGCVHTPASTPLK
eukprot:1196077-Prorocentrum_minimum.AAC.1